MNNEQTTTINKGQQWTTEQWTMNEQWTIKKGQQWTKWTMNEQWINNEQ